MIARVRDRFGVRIGIHRVLSPATVANLASCVREASREASREARLARAPTPPLAPAHARPAEGGGSIAAREQPFLPFPLTELQQAYWVGRLSGVDLGDVGSHRYMEFETEEIDVARLELAWQGLVERHDMLRMIVRSDGLQQVLRRVPAYRIEVDDLGGAAADRAAATLGATRERMGHRDLDPGRWPLFELRATRLPDGRWRLHLSLDLLVADMVSFQILARELAQLYEHPDEELEPLDLTFRDYVLADLAGRGSEEHRRAREYWDGRLSALPPAPELPLAQNPRLAGPLRFARRVAELEPEAWDALKRRAGRFGLTPSGTLLAAFAEVLATWGRSRRFTIVLTIFNRQPLHPQVDRIVGEFTSTVLLGLEGRGDQPMYRRAQQVQEQLWRDLEHSQVSGVTVLRELARAHGGAIRAAMPVVFTSTLGHGDTEQPIPEAVTEAPAPEGGGARPNPRLPVLGRVVHSLHLAPQTLLNLHAFDRERGIVFGMDAAEDLFPPGLVDDLFGAFRGLLDRMARDERVWRRRQLDLVPAHQIDVRRAVNQTAAPVSEQPLHGPLDEQAARAGDRPAVVAPDRSLTYAELRVRARALAGRLVEHGVRRGDLVAVVMAKGWEQVVAVQSVLLASAAFVPIDPRSPADRVGGLLRRIEARLALTQERLRDVLAAQHPGIAWLDVPAGEPDAEPRSGLPAVSPDDLAYVIFTSGSTGAPKGVMTTHRAAVNTVLDVNRRFGVGGEDRILALSELDFDLSVYDVFGALAAGATIVMPRAHNRDPAHWAELLAAQGVTVWNSVPAMMRMLVEYLEPRGPTGMRLRLALLSGDWIPVGLPDALRRVFSGCRVVSLGGATEAAIWSVHHPIGEVSSRWRSIPYGRPLANQRVAVLDDDLAHRPVWVPGHLHIGGLGVARGYWRDRERTAAAFVTEPRGGERLYRTGDLARFLPDGDLEILGREDFQVKVRGYRIELGEIEAVLREHPRVLDAVVVAREGSTGEARLVAYVTGDAVAGELAAHLQARLPAYMLPASYELLAELPLTPNGKVDRRALPAPSAQAATTAAATDEELAAAARLAGLVARVLGVADVEPSANLLALGATSIDIVRMANLMEEELGFRPELERLMVDPTILDVARTYAALIPAAP
jgi:amino acid adenylation domain-containing protein